MPKKIYTYECCETGKLFKTEQEAINSEQKAKEEKIKEKEKKEKNRLEKLFRQYFPAYHKKDTKYKYYCVNCGKLILEYEYIFDGIETSRGKILIDKIEEILFKGKRCKDCYKTTWEKFLRMIDYFDKQIEKIDLKIKECKCT